MAKEQKEKILKYKVLYTFMVLFIYMVGRSIPLYGIEVDTCLPVQIDAQTIFIQNMTGDMKSTSLFALGIWPYMWGTMIMLVYTAIKSIDRTNRVSQKKMNRITYEVTLGIALIQAYQKNKDFAYCILADRIVFARIFVTIQMLAGMLIVLWLCERAQKYGVGGRTGVFLVNITEGVLKMVASQETKNLILPILLAVATIPVMILLELTELRIPLQRVSIHNIHADKNYIAYKLNPVGVMPIMLTSVFFMLPQLIIRLLLGFYPKNAMLSYLEDNLILTRPVGVIVYLIVQTILIVAFSFLMLTPGSTADGLMRSGDSVLDVYAGKETRKYLIKIVFLLSAISAVILGICMGIPLFLQFTTNMSQTLAMLPCSIMMITGLWIMLGREALVYKHLEEYRPLI